MVREAEQRDLDAILELYLFLHEDSIPKKDEHLRDTWLQIIQDPNHHLIVNEVDGKIVSSCVCVIIPNLTRKIREQCTLLLRSGKGMGEYIIYYRGKIVGGVYDDRFLVKPVKTAKNMMPEAELELPYEGAKAMLLVDNIENKEFLKELLEGMYSELPDLKKKK